MSTDVNIKIITQYSHLNCGNTSFLKWIRAKGEDIEWYFEFLYSCKEECYYYTF